jgi:redox-sensitive bicupin YhaK (pirin superfamily)
MVAPAISSAAGGFMITIRSAGERGHFNHGWLDTWHTFSFADYYDPRFLGFRSLRVINDDRIEKGKGFGTHGHRDMEIVTYMLDGELEHRDSMGNGSVIHPGKVQRMTAGTGVRHSEFNPSPVSPSHLLQIWLLPDREGLKPGYEEKFFSEADRTGEFCLVASRDGRDGSLTIHQNADVLATILKDGTASHAFAAGRGGWLQVARGSFDLGGRQLIAGDGVAIEDEPSITLAGNGEALLFDLA